MCKLLSNLPAAVLQSRTDCRSFVFSKSLTIDEDQHVHSSTTTLIQRLRLVTLKFAASKHILEISCFPVFYPSFCQLGVSLRELYSQVSLLVLFVQTSDLWNKRHSVAIGDVHECKLIRRKEITSKQVDHIWKSMAVAQYVNDLFECLRWFLLLCV